MVAAALSGAHQRHRPSDAATRPRAAWLPRARGLGARLARIGGRLALGGLAGCTSVPSDDVATQIAQYYAEHASEEDGRCAAPEIASLTRRKVLASSDQVTHLRVRYSYFDPSAPGTSDWTRVLVSERECTGVAERDFTLVATDLGYKVVQMSGPVRAEP